MFETRLIHIYLYIVYQNYIRHIVVNYDISHHAYHNNATLNTEVSMAELEVNLTATKWQTTPGCECECSKNSKKSQANTTCLALQKSNIQKDFTKKGNQKI